MMSVSLCKAVIPLWCPFCGRKILGAGRITENPGGDRGTFKPLWTLPSARVDGREDCGRLTWMTSKVLSSTHKPVVLASPGTVLTVILIWQNFKVRGLLPCNSCCRSGCSRSVSWENFLILVEPGPTHKVRCSSQALRAWLSCRPSSRRLPFLPLIQFPARCRAGSCAEEGLTWERTCRDLVFWELNIPFLHFIFAGLDLGSS